MIEGNDSHLKFAEELITVRKYHTLEVQHALRSRGLNEEEINAIIVEIAQKNKIRDQKPKESVPRYIYEIVLGIGLVVAGGVVLAYTSGGLIMYGMMGFGILLLMRGLGEIVLK